MPINAVITPDRTLITQLKHACVSQGMDVNEAVQARWCRSIAVNGMEFRGDLLKPPKPHRSCLVYMLNTAPPNQHSITQELAQPVALVTAHLVMVGGDVQTLIREVPSAQCSVNSKLHCTVLRGWSTYCTLAKDTHTTTPKLVPATRLRMVATVVPCRRPALANAVRHCRQRGTEALAVVPYL